MVGGKWSGVSGRSEGRPPRARAEARTPQSDMSERTHQSEVLQDGRAISGRQGVGRKLKAATTSAAKAGPAGV